MQTRALVLAVVVAVGCRPSVAPPEGPAVQFTATVCATGMITTGCYQTPAFTLNADVTAYTQLAVATVKGFLGPAVKDVGACTVTGKTDLRPGGAIVLTGLGICPPAPDGTPNEQRVTITLTPVVRV